jgi:hypothetical protein
LVDIDAASYCANFGGEPKEAEVFIGKRMNLEMRRYA